MSAKGTFTVRPFSRPARSDLKDALRVNLSGPVLLSLKLKAGDSCLLQHDGLDERPAIAWQAVERIHDNVVQISKSLQDLCDLKLGDKVTISKNECGLLDAEDVRIREATPDEISASLRFNPIFENDKSHWEWLLHDPLSRAEFLTGGLRFDSVAARGQTRNFIVSEVGGAGVVKSSSVCKFAPTTKITIILENDVLNAGSKIAKSEWPQLHPKYIGGLDKSLEQINLLLRRFDPAFQDLTKPYNYQPTQGLLLYGPKGTGKSLVVDQMASSSWGSVVRWSAMTTGRKDAGEQLLAVFQNIIRRQPCLLIIEQIEAQASKRSSRDDFSGHGFLAALRQGFELIRRHEVMVVAEVRHPNNIDDGLRAPRCFGVEVEFPVPAVHGRLEILHCIRGSTYQPSDRVLSEVADRTHGYVGADLFALYQRLIELAAHRTLAEQDSINSKLNGLTIHGSTDSAASLMAPVSRTPSLVISPEDVNLALTSIRPTAMQEIFLDNPNVRWHDIGGHSLIKRHLQRSVSRPLRQTAAMCRLNLRSNRGILIYGPPGCSKTLLIKALATESGLNFLAVKGAELVSMYVGESERAMREVFRKARAASPSIIFFDEFDSIASKRTSGSSAEGSNMNVLTTLLNELDGFESLHDVLVIAATNRPEILDPALLRPGRIDNLIYVGPPDLEARIEILNLWLAKSDVDWLGYHHSGVKVDVPALALMLDGYSGAEIVSVCETAGGLVMDEWEDFERKEEREEQGWTVDAGSSKHKDGERQRQQSVKDVGMKIQMVNLTTAVSLVKRGITSDITRAYEEWGSSGYGGR